MHDAFTAVYMQLEHRDFEELIFELGSILERHEAEYRREPAAWLELERRVAETTLTVAIGKNQPVEVCERLLADARELGFSDLHRRAQMEIMFCGYCARPGQTGSVARVLEPLAGALRAEVERTGEDVWNEHLAACQGLLES